MNNFFKIFAVTFLLFFIACKKEAPKRTAQQIVDLSIEKSGLQKITTAKLSFSFRNKTYQAKRNKGIFEFTREFDSIKDVLNNNGFQRFVNNKPLVLADSMVTKYTNSVNSVHYFSVLPFGLNDKAVYKKLLPSTQIKGKKYYKIRVTFSENGGGEDFEDVFIYWIDQTNFKVDYLAYEYHTDGGGKRFRALKNEPIVNGIRFANYDNYKPKDSAIELQKIDAAFENNQLEKVSEIILENIKVNQID